MYFACKYCEDPVIPGSTVVQHTEDQLLALFLSEKNDLINKFSELIGEDEDSGIPPRDFEQVEARIKNNLRQELRAKLSQLEEVKK